MKYPNIVRAVAEMPWAIRPSTLAVIIDILRYRSEGHQLSQAEIDERIGAAAAARRAAAPAAQAGVAIIPIYGVLAPRAAIFAQTSSSGTGVDQLRAGFRQAMGDPEVGAILLDIDSPGGQVDQIPELAAEIREARARKPIVAIANTDAASAAYWLGAQASELSVTPSGQVGSVGVFSVHEDISAHLEMEGVRPTLISEGKYKVEGNPFEALADEAKTEIQGKVREYYGMFVDDLARGRGASVETVRKNYGEGRMLTAKKAVAAGMADRVETFDQALRRTMRLAQGSGTAVAAQGWPAPIGAAAIGRHRTATSDDEWDAAANERRCPAEAGPLRASHAWRDDDGDPDAKASYKFIHHEVSSDGSVGAANTTACSNGIAVLNGGRGGADIPAADRAGVHAHLAGHLRDADRDVPPLRSSNSFIEGLGNGPYAEHGERVTAALQAFVERTEDRRTARAAVDRDLSAGDRQRLVDVRAQLWTVAEAIDALLTEPGSAAEANAVEAIFLENEARLNGVAV